MVNPVMVVNTTSMYGDESGIAWRTCWVWCPGCNHLCAIPIAGEDGTLPLFGPHWGWDGNLEQPTFDPSILQESSGSMPKCHSYVRAGRWEFLSDCTHALAGQTVDMVPLPDWVVRHQDEEEVTWP